MRNVEESRRFKRDVKRESRGRYRKMFCEGSRLRAAIRILRSDEPLDASYRDHDLTGDWAGYRECHLAFDFLLVYMLAGDDLLVLERLGSHAEIFGM